MTYDYSHNLSLVLRKLIWKSRRKKRLIYKNNAQQQKAPKIVRKAPDRKSGDLGVLVSETRVSTNVMNNLC